MSDHKEISTLIKQAGSGDVEAFEELVRRHQDQLYNMIFRNVGDEGSAADLTQEVFIQAYKTITQYDQRAKFSTWLYRVAMNAIISRHRYTSAQKRGGQKATVALGDDATPDPSADFRGVNPGTATPDQELIRKENQARIAEAIGALDPEYRQALVLRDIEGLSYEEIAEVLDINIGTVRSRIHRARGRLRDELADLME